MENDVSDVVPSQEVMWRFVLAVGLLCWGSDGEVSCINKDGVAVDW